MSENNKWSANGKYRVASRVLLISAGIGWLAMVAVGLCVLYRYANTPGLAANPPKQWPTDSQLPCEAGTPVLVMVVHPLCSCSRASLEELSKLMAECNGRLQAFVVFSTPELFDRPLDKIALWQTAGNIPGVTRVADHKGAETGRFHAFTSGQTLLYGADGRLEFSGGITGGRGHAGDNIGRSAIVKIVHGGNPQKHGSFVFGCPLQFQEKPGRKLCCQK